MNKIMEDSFRVRQQDTALGKRDGDVLKLFKKTLSVNGSSPSFTIEKQGAILGYLHFLPEKSGTRLADVLRYY